jgi:hypothetical protein
MLDAYLRPSGAGAIPVDWWRPAGVHDYRFHGGALAHEDLDAVLLLGLGYLTCRATHWLDSPVLPREVMAERRRKMIDGDKDLVELILRQIRQFNKPIIRSSTIIGFDERASAISSASSMPEASWLILRRSGPSARWPRPRRITAGGEIGPAKP